MAAALNGKADVIVTENDSDFPSALGIPILRAVEFMEKLDDLDDPEPELIP